MEVRPLLRYFIEMVLAFSLWLPLSFLVFDDFELTLRGFLAFEGAVVVIALCLAAIRAFIQLRRRPDPSTADADSG